MTYFIYLGFSNKNQFVKLIFIYANSVFKLRCYNYIDTLCQGYIKENHAS